MASANDDFTETGANVNLTAHTPTGAGAGTSWDVLGAGGVITVDATNDRCIDGSNGNGNRYRMTNDLGFDQMDVQADITTTGAANTFPGIAGRVPNSGTGVAGVEFIYDKANARWDLNDGTTSNTASDSTPAGTVTLKLTIRTSDMRGFVGGVQKTVISSNGKSGNTRAGILLGSFSGGATGVMTLDNFLSSGVAASAGIIWVPSMTMVGVQ